MKYDSIKDLSDEQFCRLTGVKRATFAHMLNILREAEKARKAKGGRRNKLSMEDRLLMALEYLREYRTYFHISQNYGLSESSTYESIKWVEDTLVKHPSLALPGKKTLLKSDHEYEVVLIDATETPIERPKKDRESITRAKRNDTP